MSISPIRVARIDDAEAILNIYAPAVATTAISFELEPPSVQEIRERIANTLKKYPWLVFEDRGSVLGYAYGSTYRTRAAYQWSTEVSVYVHADARRMGVGRRLYEKLFQVLARQGFFNGYAVITLPNPASVALHESVGFTPIGVFHNVGHKLGQWHDVGWWQLEIQPHRKPDGPPLPFSNELLDSSGSS